MNTVKSSSLNTSMSFTKTKTPVGERIQVIHFTVLQENHIIGLKLVAPAMDAWIRINAQCMLTKRK